MFRKFRVWMHQSRAQRRRERGELPGVDWRSGLNEENDFWTLALTDPARNWKLAEYQERTNPEFELQPELRELITAPAGATVRLLDVGAGPLTRLGKKWPGRTLEITAVDPLAEKYQALSQRLKTPVLVPVRVAEAEKLTAVFPENQFDLAYASNCLDHSYDPFLAIRQMLAVVKPGCFVYLWHFANAGKEESYQGLHQWNFDIRDGDFVIGDGRTSRSLAAELGASARLNCEETRAFDCRIVIAKIQKEP